MNYFCPSADWGVAVRWVSLTSRHSLIWRRHVRMRKRGWWWKRGGGFAHRAVVLNSVPTGPGWCLWSREAVGVKTPTIRRESNTLHTTSFWVWLLLLKTTLNTCGSETRSGRCLLLNGRIVQSLAQAYLFVTSKTLKSQFCWQTQYYLVSVRIWYTYFLCRMQIHENTLKEKVTF